MDILRFISVFSISERTKDQLGYWAHGLHF